MRRERKHSIQFHRIVFSTNLPCSIRSLFRHLSIIVRRLRSQCRELLWHCVWLIRILRPANSNWLAASSCLAASEITELWLCWHWKVCRSWSGRHESNKKRQTKRNAFKEPSPRWFTFVTSSVWDDEKKHVAAYAQSKQIYLILSNFIRYPHKFRTVLKREVYAIINA